MVEVELAVAAVDTNHLLPVVVQERALIVLNQLELVREPPTDQELVFATGEVRADLIRNQPLVVLIERDSLDKTVNLAALTEDLHLTLAVKDSLLAIRAQIIELVLVDEKFG